MVGEDSYSARAAGRFSLLSTRETESRQDVDTLRQQLTVGTIDFLQRQMYENITGQIDRAVESGQAGYLAGQRQSLSGSSPLLATVRVYVGLLQSPGTLPANMSLYVTDTLRSKVRRVGQGCVD